MSNKESLDEANKFFDALMEDFVPAARQKYLKGHLEHTENPGLWLVEEEALMDYIVEEVIDFVIYWGAYKKLKQRQREERKSQG